MNGSAGSNTDLDGLFGDEAGDSPWLERVAQAVAPPDLGDLFGYRLVRVAHRGGQGTVFEGREPRTGRRVAIKHLAESEDGLDLRRRRETDALATLSHPNVVSLFAAPPEGGVLVMEWIEGTRLDEWADELFRALPRPEAIRRVVRTLAGVAAGVAAAHARGVLHRDLKPSNVLVEEDGTPKVLDFGLATAIDPADERTITRSFTGTPAWSSPEQVESGPDGVDARADVHGLGLLLYRAITGRTAFDANRPIAAIFDDVRELVPPPPSRLRPGVPREIDLIAARALEKDPARRYPTAEDFRRDLQRFLEGQPVEAHPPHPLYLARKFVRRHPGATAGVALAALATLVGTVATVRFAVDAGRSRDEALVRTTEAERARNSAERMNALLVDLLGRAREREATGDPAGVQGILLAAAESLKRDPPPPEAEVDLQITIATALAEIGESERSLVHFARAEELLLAAGREREILPLRLRRSETETRLFAHEAALRSASRAAEIADRLQLPDGERAQATSRLSYTLSEVGRHEEGLAAAERAMALAKDADAEVRASVHARYGLALNRNGRLPEGIEAARRSVALAESEAAVPATTRSRCLYNLGFLLIGDGRCDEAIRPLERALELRINGYGATHSSTVPPRAMLATALRQCGRFDEAIATLEPALPALQGDGPLAAGERARINREIGKVHLARRGPGDDAQAVDRLEEALADLVRLGSGNLRRFQLVVPTLIEAIERRDGRSAAMQAAVSLGDRFAGDSDDPLIATAIRIAAIDRLAAAPAAAWPEGLPIATLRGDLERLEKALEPDASETLECELVLTRLLAASGDAGDQAEATERASSLAKRAEAAGRVAEPVARAAARMLEP